MKAIDIHSHLSAPEYNEDRNDMLTRALAVCDAIIDIGSGTSPRAFDDARSLAESYEPIYFTAGIHPHDAEAIGADDSLKNALEKSLPHKKCVAVGECGLDYYYDNAPRKKQQEVFEWQIGLATQYKVPLMIHTRDAESDTQELLKKYSGRGVFHCFTGTYEMAKFGIDRGFMISFSGIVTFKKADDLRDVFMRLPLDSVVIETDAPYLAPVPMRGKRNESEFIQYTAQFLANLKKMPVEEFTQKTSQNALSLFEKMDKGIFT